MYRNSNFDVFKILEYFQNNMNFTHLPGPALRSLIGESPAAAGLLFVIIESLAGQAVLLASNRALAIAADLDEAAVSRAVQLLKARGFIRVAKAAGTFVFALVHELNSGKKPTVAVLQTAPDPTSPPNIFERSRNQIRKVARLKQMIELGKTPVFPPLCRGAVAVDLNQSMPYA